MIGTLLDGSKCGFFPWKQVGLLCCLCEHNVQDDLCCSIIAYSLKLIEKHNMKELLFEICNYLYQLYRFFYFIPFCKKLSLLNWDCCYFLVLKIKILLFSPVIAVLLLTQITTWAIILCLLLINYMSSQSCKCLPKFLFYVVFKHFW